MIFLYDLLSTEQSVVEFDEIEVVVSKNHKIQV